MGMSTIATKRFWSKVKKSDHCWIWIAGRGSGGYGRFYTNGQTVPAHRWAYESLRGTVPNGLILDHLCRNRQCVNPEHMEPVTNKQNVLRGAGITAQEAERTHCPAGHVYDLLNTHFYQGRRYCKRCRNEWNRQYSQRPEVKSRAAARSKRRYWEAPEKHRAAARERMRGR